MVVSETDFRGDDGIDMETALAEMAELDAVAGDWKEHLPYDAAISYFADESVREQFEAHVGGCVFCQEMLDALNPSNQILGELHQAAMETYIDNVAAAAAAEEQPTSTPERNRGWYVIPVAASLVAGFVLGSQYPIMPKLDSGPMIVAEDSRGGFIPVSFEDIAVLEESPTVEDQFLAARLYFDNNLDLLAYRRLGDGLEYAGADGLLVRAVSDVPNIDALNAHTLRNAEMTLLQLQNAEISRREDYVRKIEVSAALGLRESALAAIDGYLRTDTDTQEIASVFDRVVLNSIYQIPNETDVVEEE